MKTSQLSLKTHQEWIYFPPSIFGSKHFVAMSTSLHPRLHSQPSHPLFHETSEKLGTKPDLVETAF